MYCSRFWVNVTTKAQNLGQIRATWFTIGFYKTKKKHLPGQVRALFSFILKFWYRYDRSYIWPPKICNKIYGTRLNLDKFAKEQMHQLGKIDPINVNKFGKFGCTISLRVKFTSFCSNIDSKSSNNTYLNIIKILFLLLFFKFHV